VMLSRSKTSLMRNSMSAKGALYVVMIELFLFFIERVLD
jgi:hypothetical protein